MNHGEILKGFCFSGACEKLNSEVEVLLACKENVTAPLLWEVNNSSV